MDSSLQTIKIDPTGRLVALGAGDGTSVIGSFSDSLLDNNKFERQEINSQIKYLFLEISRLEPTQTICLSEKQDVRESWRTSRSL